MKTLLFTLFFTASAWTGGFFFGEAHELHNLQRELEASGAVGAPGNPLGIPSTNFVVIPEK